MWYIDFKRVAFFLKYSSASIYYIAFSPIKRWALFFQLLNMGWPYYPFWPIELRTCYGVPVLNSSETLACFNTFSRVQPPCKVAHASLMNVVKKLGPAITITQMNSQPTTKQVVRPSYTSHSWPASWLQNHDQDLLRSNRAQIRTTQLTTEIWGDVLWNNS